MKRYVIVGNGIAGVSGAQAIRKEDGEGLITILSDEDRPFYSRPLIVDVMTGRRREDEILLLDEGGHRLRGFDLRLGVTVEAVDAKGAAVIADGKRIPYDRLLIAAGARPKMPFRSDGDVRPLRTLTDARAVAARLPQVRHAVVYGGGPVGMKAAHALLLKGIPVTVVVTSSHILSRVLDNKTAARMEELFRAHGAFFRFDREITGVVAGSKGLAAVVTDRGEEIPGQLMIVAKGVAPDCTVAAEAGMDTDVGIVVGETMETSIPGVYAAGDVAQGPRAGDGIREVVSLWHVGAGQGRVAGVSMAGGNVAYEGSVGSNSMEFFGTACISMGRVTGEDCEEVIVEGKDVYARYLFRGPRLQGALLMGNIEEAGVILRALREGMPISDRSILVGKRPAGQSTMEVLF
jgi:NADPH-dependent 2,4-dienoyl-CoA reductase/sulfur reductase-like enzyme